MTDDARDINDYLDAAEDLEEPIRFDGPDRPEPTEPDDGTWEGEGGSLDPFDEANVKQVSLIVSMRIYDALMALLETQDEVKAQELHRLHETGGIAYSLPNIDLS